MVRPGLERHTSDRLYQAIIGAAVVLAVALALLALHGAPHSVPAPSRVVTLGGILIVLMALLWQCVALYRRARDNTRLLEAAAAARERETALLHLINETPDGPTLARQAGLLFREWFDCDAVGIRWRQGDDYPYLESSGFPPEFVQMENELCQHGATGAIERDATGLPVLECMCGNILRGRTDPAYPFFTPAGSFWTNSTTRLLASTTEADRQARTRNRCHGEGYESVALIPLRFGDTIYGLLQLNSKRPDRFTLAGIEFLERMAGGVALRLAQHEARREAQRLAEELQARNQELATANAELRAGNQELLAAQHDLSEAEVMYRSVSELVPYGLWMNDAEGQPVYLSPSLLTMMGLSWPVDRETYVERVHPEDLPRLWDVVAEALGQHTDFALEYRVRGQDGAYRWLLCTGVPRFGEAGQYLGHIGRNLDITDRKQREERVAALADEAQRRAAELHGVIEATADGIIIYGQGDTPETMNPAARRMLQYSEAEASLPLSERLKLRQMRTPDGQPLAVEQAAAYRAQHGETVTGQRLIISRPGQPDIWVSVGAVPLRDEAGQLIGAVATVTDITELVRAQQTAEGLAEELATVIDAMTDPVVVYDRKGRLVRHNPAANRMVKRSQAAEDVHEVYATLNMRHPDGALVSLEEMPGFRALHGETVQAEHLVVSDAEGTDLHVLASSAPLYLSGELSGAVNVWRDITELQRQQAEIEEQRRRAEEATGEAQRRAGELDAVIDTIADGVMLLDAAGSVLHANEAARRLLPQFGGDPDQTIAERVAASRPRSVSGAPLALEDAPSYRALHGEAVRNFVSVVTGADGQDMWISSSGAPLRDTHGVIAGAVMTFGDITPLMQAQHAAQELAEELAATNEELRTSIEELVEAEHEAQRRAAELDTIIGTIPDGVVILDATGMPRRENPAAVSLFGWTWAERRLPWVERMLGRDPRDGNGEPLAAGDLPAARSLRGEIVSGAVFCIRCETQTETWLLVNSAPLLSAEGALVGTVATFVDITTMRQAQELLSESEQRLRLATAGARLGVFDWRIPADTAHWDERMYEIFGRDPERGPVNAAEFFADFIMPEDREEFERVLTATAERGGTFDVACRIRRENDGVQCWIEYFAQFELAADGTPLRLVGVVADVTERKQAEAALRQSEQDLAAQRSFLQQVIDQMPSGVLVIDADSTRVVLANRAIAAIWNRDMAGVVMRDFLGAMRATGPGGELTEAAQWPGLRALAGEVLQNQVVRVSRPDGTVMHISANAAPVRDEHGRVTAAIVAATDVTPAAEAQEELARYRDHLEQLVAQRTEELVRSERSYRELVQTAKSAIIRYAPDGTMTFVNEYAEELFGYEPGELQGQPVMTLVPKVEERTGRSLEGLKDAVVADPVALETSENENVTKDGRRLWMVWTNRALYDEQGNFAGIMCIGIDRTAQHEAQQKVAAYQDQLRQLAAEVAIAEQRERQRIATGLHDDVSQTLAAAKMQLAQTRWAETPAEQNRRYEALAASLNEAIEETRNLTYDLSSPILFQKGLAAAAEWVGARVHELHGLPVKVVRLSAVPRLAEDIEVTVFQAVKELLNNVVKHAAATHVDVQIGATARELSLTVADDGRGFQPTAIGLHSGGGFGLLNMRERLAYLGGQLTVESSPGRGTRSTITMPLNEGDPGLTEHQGAR